MTLGENEHIENISDRLQLIVSPEHTFGTDALLLAAFALPRRTARTCDLGTGCGVIPFYLLARGLERCACVELQSAAADQLARSAAFSGVSDRLDVVCADLRRLEGVLPAGGFDCVTMNPPYTKAGHGIQSADGAKRTARHETDATLPEIASAAARLLKFGGAFCMCMRPERLAEAVAALQAASLEPKRLRFVAKAPGSAPWLFLIEGKKGRAPGVSVLPTLYLYDENGAFTPEYLEITATYRK